MLIISSCILWTVTYAFALRLQAKLYSKDIEGVMVFNDRHFWPEIKGNYVALKHLSKLTNDVVGIRLIVFLLKAVLYYTIMIDGITKWAHFVQVAAYVYATVIFCVISADVTFQVR